MVHNTNSTSSAKLAHKLIFWGTGAAVFMAAVAGALFDHGKAWAGLPIALLAFMVAMLVFYIFHICIDEDVFGHADSQRSVDDD